MLLQSRFAANPQKVWHMARYTDGVWHLREMHHRDDVAVGANNYFLMGACCVDKHSAVP
jgi:hypothetical protein